MIFPWRNFSWRKRISVKWAQDFLALFEKTMKKINMRIFFTESKEQD